MVIGIIEHGERRLFSYGAARPDSVFKIESVTKTFTGLALAQLVQQGMVGLNDPISTFLPGIARPGDHKEITLLSLATHDSGLPSIASRK